MKTLFIASAFSLLVFGAPSARAQPASIIAPGDDGGGGGGGGGTGAQPNLTYHGGSKIVNAKMVYIFWGWSASGALGSGEFTSELIAYRKLAMQGRMGMLAQYSASQSAGLLNSGVADVFDPVAPPLDITDLDVQHEIQKYFHDQIDPWTIYTVILPRGVTVTGPTGERSCNAITGGTLCGYHHHFWDNGSIGSTHARYAVIPYPDCCRPTGFGDATAAEVTILHEVRETMTNPHGDAWYDSYHNEADDKCSSLTFVQFAPAPPPYYNRFFAFGFQQEWSNADHGCVQ
jgi:hypothetical protein